MGTLAEAITSLLTSHAVAAFMAGQVATIVMDAVAPTASDLIRQSAQQLMNRVLSASALKIVDLAALLAGRKHPGLREEWGAHLAGRQYGQDIAARQKLHTALGFVLAALRYRLQDLADLLWRPADTVLASRELSSLVVLFATLSVSVLFIRMGGLYGLADHLGSVAVVWGAAFGLIRVGRWWRGVRPPEHKPRRKSELARLALTRSRVTSLPPSRC